MTIEEIMTQMKDNNMSIEEALIIAYNQGLSDLNKSLIRTFIRLTADSSCSSNRRKSSNISIINRLTDELKKSYKGAE